MTFKGRTCLYHFTCPKGRVFTDVREYREALKGGWVDAPWEIENQEYHPADYQWAMSPEVPEAEVKKADESPPGQRGSKETASPNPMAGPAPSEPMKPWQKAQLARKAKREAQIKEKGV